MEKAENLMKRLPFLDIVQLREQWLLYYFGEAGGRASAKWLRLAIAYRVQELEFDTVARCEAIRKKAVQYQIVDGDIGHGRTTEIKRGTRLLREYKGKIHEVLAIENGRFVYDGQLCRSLSEAARKITGSTRVGTVFFGVKKKHRRVQDA